MSISSQQASNQKTLVDQVMETIRNQIGNRQISQGDRLPSIRALSQRLKVSKSTIVTAYERLVAQGEITSRPGSGYYVSGHILPFALSSVGPNLDQQVDPVWISRHSLDATIENQKPGCGWLPPPWMPEADIRRALRALARNDANQLTDYASPHGLPELRKLLSRQFTNREISAHPDQIILTESGTQAIDLLCRFFLDPGDTVLIDDPCYFNFQALLRAHRTNLISVNYQKDGPDLDQFEAALREHKPRLYLTNSALHNPTGASLSPVIAHKLLKLADQHDLLIIEDDIFADFEHKPAPRLSAFDGLERVIYMGSYSKTLSASIRCGYIAANSKWTDEIVNFKLATNFGGGNFSSALVLALLKDGSYRKHINQLNTKLAAARTSVAKNLKELELTPWIEPQAGMFLWCQLPNKLDATNVTKQALEQNVMLAPGNAFSLTQSASDFLRFNVSQMNDPSIYEILAQSMDAAARNQ